jgi:hypothetical protein
LAACYGADQVLSDVVRGVKGKLVGLEYRIKSESSLFRKIMADLDAGRYSTYGICSLVGRSLVVTPLPCNRCIGVSVYRCIICHHLQWFSNTAGGTGWAAERQQEDGLNLAQVCDQCYDVLRYTCVLPGNVYTDGVTAILKHLDGERETLPAGYIRPYQQ